MEDDGRMQKKLIPDGTKGHVSVAQLRPYWYVACQARELRARPIYREVLGQPMVLFRDGHGTAHGMLDRCPHRNVPLSLGKVANGRLECAYHGWQFDGSGRCRHVPGLVDSDDERGAQKRRVEAFATRESEGLIWVYGQPDAVPDVEPFTVGRQSSGYTRIIREVSAEASVHAVAENALDVPHTSFLHKGLFRTGRRNRVQVAVRRNAHRVEAEYLGEPRPPGLAGWLLSPSGGIVEHWDRFILPSVAQVEYRLGKENHFLVTSLCTPVADFRTRMFAIVDFRTRLPGFLIKPFLQPLALKIFQQDARILAEQTRVIHAFGGEQYMSTSIDILGPSIWRLLKQAEQANAPIPPDEDLQPLQQVELDA